MRWDSDYQRAVMLTMTKSVKPDFGKPLPKKEKREGESEFQHKIRQWTDEVKERPGRFPGGHKQAVAIAAQQAGVSKADDFDVEIEIEPEEENGLEEENNVEKSIFDGWISSMKKGAAGVGFGTGQGMGQAAASPEGNQLPAVVSAGRQAAGILTDNTVGSQASPKKQTAAPAAQSAQSSQTTQQAAQSAATGATIQAGGPTGNSTGIKTGPRGGIYRETAGGGRSYYKSLEKEDYQHQGSSSCDACKAGTCDHASKALTSRSMAIPFYLRGPNAQKYDPEGIFRSATQPTSRQYTALAPAVRETLNRAAEESEMRAKQGVTAYKSCAAHGVMFKSQHCPACETAKSQLTTRKEFAFRKGY